MKKSYAAIFIAAAAILIGAISYFSFKSPVKNPGETAIQFSNQPVSQLTEVKDSQIVDLKNGDAYDLTASIVKKNINGTEMKMLAYNGSIPGPTIRVAQGSEVTVNFTNNTDVPTTLHSHGVRLDNQFDGLPDITQAPIAVGKTFTYKIKFPDAGVFWYHPHIREDYAQPMGLYGNYLVTPTDVNYWSPVNQEWPITVGDLLMQNGSFAPFNSNKADHTLMGRYGNTFLVNGNTNTVFEAKQGEVARMYITNTATARPFNLTIPGIKIKLVGSDNGRVTQEQFVDSVILAPSERVIIEAYFDQPATFPLLNKTPANTATLANIHVTADKSQTSYMKQFSTLRTNNDIAAAVPNLESYFNKPDDKAITLTLAMNGMGMGSGMHMMGNGQSMSNGSMGGMGDSDKIEWEDTMTAMNQNSTTDTLEWKLEDQATGKANDQIDWSFKKGDMVKIKIFNDPSSMHPMQHPIHFHGNRFLVLTTNGAKNDNLAWKDTVLVQKGDTVEILVDMSNPGTWMAHCHIAEHLESGMMLKYKVN